MIVVAALFLFGYLLGSLPFGVWVAKAHGIDILKVASGNIGATNVSRALGKWWGVAVFLLDMAKGCAPALAARALVTAPIGGFDPQFLWLLVGFSAVLGHVKSPFLGFRGGKGVSTAMGAALGASPLVALSSFSLFLVVLLTVQYMVIASVVGVSSAFLFAAFYPHESRQTVWLFAALAFAIVVMHRTNFKRLRNGEEPKFRFKK
jgi:acyl phosphate:glycerol-3-phosphate acyltransferase